MEKTVLVELTESEIDAVAGGAIRKEHEASTGIKG